MLKLLLLLLCMLHRRSLTVCLGLLRSRSENAAKMRHCDYRWWKERRGNETGRGTRAERRRRRRRGASSTRYRVRGRCKACRRRCCRCCRRGGLKDRRIAAENEPLLLELRQYCVDALEVERLW